MNVRQNEDNNNHNFKRIHLLLCRPKSTWKSSKMIPLKAFLESTHSKVNHEIRWLYRWEQGWTNWFSQEKNVLQKARHKRTLVPPQTSYLMNPQIMPKLISLRYLDFLSLMQGIFLLCKPEIRSHLCHLENHSLCLRLKADISHLKPNLILIGWCWGQAEAYGI